MKYSDKQCRLCGIESNTIVNIIEAPDLLNKIEFCLHIQVLSNDNLPKNVCSLCDDTVNQFYKYSKKTLDVEKMLHDFCDSENPDVSLNSFMDDSMQSNSFVKIPDIAVKIQKLPNIKIKKLTGNSVLQKDTALFLNTQKLEVQEVLHKLKTSASQITVSKYSGSKSVSKAIVSETLESHLENDFNIDGDDNECYEELEYDEDHSEDYVPESDVDSETEEIELKERKNKTNKHILTMNVEDISKIVKENDKKAAIPTVELTDPSTINKEPIKDDIKIMNKKRKRAPVVIVNMKSPAAYVCMICKQKFISFELLREHMKNSEKCKMVHLKCDVCNKICDTRKSLYQHSLTHREKKGFVCDECGKSYSYRFNLQNHQSSVHGESVDDYGNIYRCKKCDEQFTNRKQLYAHLNNHSVTKPMVHLCDTCGKCLNSLDALRSHFRIHQNIRPFKCDTCDKGFRSRLHLTQHTHVHTGIKPFVCATCNKSFAKKGSLVCHQRVHTGETPYKCPLCNEKFASLGKLKTHRKSHRSK